MRRGLLALGLIVPGLVGLALVSGLLEEVSRRLYRTANTLYAFLAPWVDGLRWEVGVPWLSAFLLGVLAAFAPLMVLVGLGPLGVVCWPLASGCRRTGGPGWGGWGRFLGPLTPGGVYGLAFCPTLFWLFFGLLLPLALASPWGFLFPLLFALGTGLPLAFLLWLFTRLGRGQASRVMRLGGRALLRGAGIVFVALGLLDTVLYWNL